MRKLLLVVLSTFFCSILYGTPIEQQKDFPCVLLCDEVEKDMIAYIFMGSHCCVSTSTKSPLDLIEPAQIYKMWIISSRKPEFKEYVEKYCLKYSDKIKGVILVKLKEGYQLPPSLMPLKEKNIK